MTTIVATRDGIYADSKCTVGELHYPEDKVYRIGKNLIGVAGDNAGIEVFLRWWCGNRKKPLELGKGQSFTALVVSKHGIWIYGNCSLGDKLKRDWHAIGSGAGVAIGAIRMGASPQEAIRIACEETNFSGAPVEFWPLKESKA